MAGKRVSVPTRHVIEQEEGEKKRNGDVLQMCFVGLNREWVQSGKTTLKSVGGILFHHDVELLLIQLTEILSPHYNVSFVWHVNVNGALRQYVHCCPRSFQKIQN
jgi:hypothetical protein